MKKLLVTVFTVLAIAMMTGCSDKPEWPDSNDSITNSGDTNTTDNNGSINNTDNSTDSNDSNNSENDSNNSDSDTNIPNDGDENNTENDTPKVRQEITGKLGKYNSPYEVGDIVFSDGTATPYSESLTLTTEQKAAAIAVIFYKGTGVNNPVKINGKTTQDETTVRTLGVGLHKSENPVTWATFDYDGITVAAEAHGYNFKINPLIITDVWDSSEKRYDFRFGDKNGKNHLQVLGAYLDDPYDDWYYKDNPPGDDTDNPALYEAFYFAKNYKDITGNNVKGTNFENDWYLPALAELYELYLAFGTVKAANDLCGGDEFKLNEEIDSKHKNFNYYWSSNVVTGKDCFAYAMSFTEDWGFTDCEKSLTESNRSLKYGEEFLDKTYALAIREF